MAVSRFCAGALLALAVAGGIVCTTATPASAQESALAATRDRVRQQPISADAGLAHGRALRRAGREADALTELRRARVFAKGAAEITVTWEIARTHIARRDFYAASNACSEVKKIVPGGPTPARVCMAEAHLLWRRGTEALAELDELAKAKDATAEVQYFAKIAEGRVRELDAKDAEAEARFREAIALAPNRPEAHVHLGVLLQRAGKGGVAELKRAAELDRTDPAVQYELGRALAASAPTRGEGIAAYERAIAERPGFVEAHRALTEALVADGRLADAKRSAAVVLKLAPGDVLAHVVSGRVALAEGKLADALKEGEAALKIQPNEGKAKLLVADAYAKQGEIDLALEAYQKASGLDPLDPAPLVNATHACLAANRVTSAKAFGQRAVLDFPDHAAAWVAQGDALVADGNKAAARTAYESAKKARGADLSAIATKLARLE